MASDILLSIGISTEEARRGHDQIIAYNQDIARSYAGIIDAMGKITPAQARVVAEIEKTKRAEIEAATAAAANAVKAEQNALKREAAERRVSAVHKEQIQTIHQVIAATTGLGSGFKSAKDSADVFARVMPQMGGAANQAGQHIGNMRGIVGQAGLQIADLAIVSQMGSQAIGQMGIQVGQFLGVLGPTGAVIGAAVTILGVLAGSYMSTSNATDAATDAQKRYNDTLDAATPIFERYFKAKDEAQGRSENWRSEQKAILDTKNELNGLLLKREEMVKNTNFFRTNLSFAPSKEEFRDIDIQIGNLREQLIQLEKTPDQTNALKVTKAISDMADERRRELSVTELATTGRERQAAVLRAELETRQKLQAAKAQPDIVQREAEASGIAAGKIWDLTNAQKEREKAQRLAEASAKRAETEQKNLEKQYLNSIIAAEDYVRAIDVETKALQMSERDAASFREGKRLEAQLRKANGGVLTDEAAALVRYAEAATLAREDAEKLASKRKKETLTQDQLRQNAMQLSPSLAATAQIDFLQKYRDELIQQGATESDIAYAVEDANIRKLESSRQWYDGASAAMMRYNRDASNYSAMTGRVVSNSFTAMENAIVGFSSKTMTASEAFKSMANSIIQDLIRMQVRASITGPLSGFLSQGIGSIFGGGTQVYGSAGEVGPYMNEGPSLPARASGGPVSAGTMYQVNELGAEMFVPGTNGYILNANDTAAALSPKASNSNASSGAGPVVQITNYVEAGVSMVDVEAAVRNGVSNAAPFIISSAVQQSVPMAVGATKSRIQRAGGVGRWSK